VAGEGVAVIAGIFPPGSVVRLTHVPDETVLRPEGGDEVERRIVDDNGNVGFADLEVGERYFASGYVSGFPVDVRVTGTDVNDVGNFTQPPVQSTLPAIGTQQEKQEPERPAVPDESLEVGVPEAALAQLPPDAVGGAPAATLPEGPDAAPSQQPPPPEQGALPPTQLQNEEAAAAAREAEASSQPESPASSAPEGEAAPAEAPAGEVPPEDVPQGQEPIPGTATAEPEPEPGGEPIAGTSATAEPEPEPGGEPVGTTVEGPGVTEPKVNAGSSVSGPVSTLSPDAEPPAPTPAEAREAGIAPADAPAEAAREAEAAPAESAPADVPTSGGAGATEAGPDEGAAPETATTPAPAEAEPADAGEPAFGPGGKPLYTHAGQEGFDPSVWVDSGRTTPAGDALYEYNAGDQPGGAATGAVEGVWTPYSGEVVDPATSSAQPEPAPAETAPAAADEAGAAPAPEGGATESAPAPAGSETNDGEQQTPPPPPAA
jgi:nicotinate-nucleotide--dimethylbenzimidazole phosphoribosyltransferase